MESARAAPVAPAAPQLWRLGLLAGANLLASVGGGRVLSAGKGVTDIAALGSGSLLAFLAGSALGLGLLVLARRHPLGRGLIAVSFSALLSSLLLLAILWFDAAAHPGGRAVPTVWEGGGATLSGPAAWLFFLALLLRCALWFASRSLRSDLAAGARLSWLALTEATYFLGFIVGLLLGPVSLAGHGGVVGALLLDLLLLAFVAGCDLVQWRPLVPAGPLAAPRQSKQGASLERVTFWRLTGAFGAAAIACQVVVFHFADVLAQSRTAALSTWTDATVATFYLGVATSAALCSWSRPALAETGQRAQKVRLRLASWEGAVPLLLLITLAGVLTLAGILGITFVTAGAGVRSPWSPAGLLSLLVLGVGAGTFEVLTLALMGRVSAGGSGAVALAIGLAATAAAIALFLMTLGGVRLSGWVAATVVGLALATWLARGTGNGESQ